MILRASNEEWRRVAEASLHSSQRRRRPADPTGLTPRQRLGLLLVLVAAFGVGVWRLVEVAI